METQTISRVALKLTGNTLIVLAALLLSFVYYPYAKLYVAPQKINAVSLTDTHSVTKSAQREYEVTIPKINAQAPIIRNVNPWNKDEYMQALNKGVAQTNSSVDAGEKGETYLFAHSSLPAWQMTRINTAFLRLGELQKGDEVEVSKNGHIYKYVVYEKKVVSPTDLEYLKGNSFDGLILQTCSPVGTDWNRLLVFAKLSSG